MTELQLTTHFGMEDLALEEMRLHAAARGLGTVAGELRPGGHRGHVRVSLDSPMEEVMPVVRGMRSIHHALRGLDVFELPTTGAIERICERVGALSIRELDEAESFRVRCRRVGAHEFGSPDVERAAGGVLGARPDLRVDLTNPQVCVRVDVRDQVCTVAVALTSKPLSLRHQRRPYQQRTALKATIAWALLRMSGLDPSRPTRLLDPFCGSGTILLEAGEVLPQASLFGSDFRSAAATGAASNLDAAGLGERSEVRRADARRLGEAWDDARFDAVVTNPPYGSRMGRGMRFEGFYRILLEHLRSRVEVGAPVVMLSLRPRALLNVARTMGFRVGETRDIESGGVTPTAVVLHVI